MGGGKLFKILKQFQISQFVFLGFIIAGFYILLFVPTFPMKLLGTGIVVLSFIGLIISLYRAGEISGRDEYSELRKPSEPLPSDLKINVIETDNAKIKTFENISENHSGLSEAIDRKKKINKKKTSLLQSLIDFVAKSNAENFPTFKEEKETLKAKKYDESTSEQIGEETFTDGDSGFRIIRKRDAKPTDKNKETDSVEEKKVESPEEKETNLEIIVATDAGKEKFESRAEYIKTSQERIEATQTNRNYSEFKSKDFSIDVPTKVKKDSEVVDVDFRNRELQIDFTEFNNEEIVFKGEPIREMSILFEKMLNVVRTVTKTQTVAFYLVNSTNDQLILQALVSERGKEELHYQSKIPIGGDLVSQLVKRRKPEIIDLINQNAVLDLLPYYSKPVKVESFIGVPIVKDKSVKAILCADTNVKEVYDAYSVNFFIHYSKIFDLLFEVFSKKYQLYLESQILNLINEVNNWFFSSNLKLLDLLKNVSNGIINKFGFTTVGICLYDFDSKNYRVFEISSKKNFDLDLRKKEVDMRRSLLGKSLNQKQTLIEKVDEGKIRVNLMETKIKKGFFFSVPMKAREGIYGAIFGYFEKWSGSYEFSIKMLDNVAFLLGIASENDRLYSELVEKLSIQTNNYNSQVQDFMQRLEEECIRANDFGLIFSVCKISIDNYLFDDSIIPQFELETRKVLLKYLYRILKPYDVVGEFEDGTIGLILIGRTGRDSKFDLDDVRKNIAQTQLKINNENIFFTISVGIAQFSPGIDVNKIYDNLKKAWEISLSRGNLVTLY